MKTIKGLLKKSEDQRETLLTNSSIPLSSGSSPVEILMGQQFRTAVPVVPLSLDPQWSHFQDGGIEGTELKQAASKERL